MIYKTAELEGALLDAAVAKALGYASVWDVPGSLCGPDTTGGDMPWSPSDTWEQGGPIIERDRIAISPGIRDADWWARGPTAPGAMPKDFTGLTPLTAAMRAKVASVYGEEVELP